MSTAVPEGQPQAAADELSTAFVTAVPEDQPPQAAADQPQAAECGQQSVADMTAEDALRALKPVSPRGTPVPRVPSGGCETYMSAIVSHSGRQLRQVVLGMTDAELVATIGKVVSVNPPATCGSPGEATASSSQDCQPQAADQCQLQAAIEVAANVPEEPAMHAMLVLDTRGPGEEPAMHAMPVLSTPGPEEELQGHSCQSDLAGFSPLGDCGGIRVP